VSSAARIIIVHGYKPGRRSGLSPQFRARLDAAISLASTGTYDAIIVSGGPTRAGLPTEASVGSAYLKGKSAMPVVIEDRSLSTYENVRNVRALYLGQTMNGTVIMGRTQLPRTRALYQRVWPEAYPALAFKPTYEPTAWYVPMLEVAYRLGSAIDPAEQFVGRVFKRLFRNA
jgi:uncharacterized SAM-binding protein YcdF (DUF218 family)